MYNRRLQTCRLQVPVIYLFPKKYLYLTKITTLNKENVIQAERNHKILNIHDKFIVKIYHT